jgi:CRISPR-associated protein Cas1
MGTVTIDRRGTRLDFDRGALRIQEPEGLPRSVPLNLVDRLVIIGNSQVSARLLSHLAANGTSVMILPGRGQDRGSFLQGYGHGDAARRLGQYRLLHDPAQQRAWARRLVRLRLAGQERVLVAGLTARPDQRRPLTAARNALQAARTGLRADALDLARLRGREGAATAAFFRGYHHLFPESLGFTGRNRRPPRDPVNAVLSLAYTLVHGDALRAVASAGLETTLGVLHEPTYGRDSLACDLAELGRAPAEYRVWRLFAEQTLTAQDFATQGSAVLLKKSARGAFFRAYERHAPAHRRWLRRAARTFAQACSEQGADAKPTEAE